MLKSKWMWMLVGFMAISTLAVAAPERTGRWDAGVSVAGAIPSDGDIDGTTQVGGSVAYGVTEWFAVGFSGGWQNHDIEGTTNSGITVQGTEVTGVPLFGDLIFRVPTGDKPFTPYGVVGLGTVLWDIDDTTASAAGVPVSVITEVDTEFAVKLGGGIDWFLNDHWIVNFDAAYVFNNPNAVVTATVLGTSASTSENIDLDYWTIGGGLKFVF